jgi:serine/threonine protein kinase
MERAQRELPRAFGPFEVLAEIGRGGCATVYKARHKPTGSNAAIKVPPSFLELEPDSLERFKREFTAIRQLKHPNIVRSLAMGLHDDMPYLVLEFVPGKNLEERIKLTGAVSCASAAAIFLQVAEGLRYLHANHILHRDIKPSNIFVANDKSAKLGDFGLLKKLTESHQLTRSRQGMGTMEYGAPEQFEDAKRVDHRCDLYSLAATLYTALTGKFPFGKGSHLQVMQRKFLNQFVPLRLLLPAIDPAIDELVCRSLDPDPAKRPRDCDELIGILRAWRTDLQPAATEKEEVFRIRPGKERRVTLRFAVDLTATFVPFHQNMRGRWEATVLDLSAAGIRLRTLRAVAANSVLQINLGRTSHLALVHWVEPEKDQAQIAGCSFVHPLPSQELNALCHPGGHKTAS